MSSSTDLLHLARTKLHTSIVDNGNSLYRWVLLKNSILRESLLTNNGTSGPHMNCPLTTTTTTSSRKYKEHDSMDFPGAVESVCSTQSEAQWLDALLGKLTDEDDDDDDGESCSDIS
ncbi:hypothetical protein APHAL10511_000699 [Amanita phalloides]|nr:hypothetical protein APHAL10511_000699 [Amanita phalloides]